MAGVRRELTRRQDAGIDESFPEVLVDDLCNGRHDLLPGSILLDTRGELHQMIDNEHLLDERGVTHRPAALQIVFRPLGSNWIAAPPTSGFLGGHFWTES